MDELRRRAQTLIDHPPVAPRPVAELRRRALRRRARYGIGAGAAAAVVVAAVVALVFVVAGNNRSTAPRVAVTPTSTVPPVAIGAPNSFVSTRGEQDTPSLTVAVSDTRTAKVLETLLSIPNDGSYVTGTAIAPNGDVWVTVDKGPKLLGHVADGNPQPHTCASSVLAIDPRTGKSTTVLRGGDDELISDAQPSPTGDRAAYLHSGCATAAVGSTLEVRNLSTGAIVSVGAQAAHCDFLRDPRWTPDGRDLVVVFANASCNNLAPGQLVLVSAETSQPGLNGTEVAPAALCAYDAVAVTSAGYAAVEHCGLPHSNFPEQLYIDGSVQLVRFDAGLHVVARTPLGTCEDGSSIAGDHTSATVVVSTYQFCAAAGGNPITKVFVDTGLGPVRQIAALSGGFTAVDSLAF